MNLKLTDRKSMINILFLFLLVILLALSSSYISHASSNDNSWYEAYKQFLMNDVYLKTSNNFYFGKDSQPLEFALKDIGGDGIPELFITTGDFTAAGMGNCVYSYINGEVVYIGIAGFRTTELLCNPVSDYPGVYCHSGNMGYYPGIYYYMSGKDYRGEEILVINEVANSMGDYDYVETITTTDIALYNAFNTDTVKLPQYTIDQINLMTWKEFVKHSLVFDGIMTDVTEKDNTNMLIQTLTPPSNAKVYIDGVESEFEIYNINGYNYFKLRDISFVLNGTQKQFNVTWSGDGNIINMESKSQYTPVGGEMQSRGVNYQVAEPSNAKLALDGHGAVAIAFNIQGNNYFKLRDIAAAIDFYVAWDNTKNVIIIDTSLGYSPEEYSMSELQAKEIFINAVSEKWYKLGFTKDQLNKSYGKDEPEYPPALLLLGISKTTYQGSKIFCFGVDFLQQGGGTALVFSDGSIMFSDNPGFEVFSSLFDFDIYSGWAVIPFYE